MRGAAGRGWLAQDVFQSQLGGAFGFDQIRYKEAVWGKAVNRAVADGISPGQAVDEAIARIKQILSE